MLDIQMTCYPDIIDAEGSGGSYHGDESLPDIVMRGKKQEAGCYAGQPMYNHHPPDTQASTLFFHIHPANLNAIYGNKNKNRGRSCSTKSSLPDKVS